MFSMKRVASEETGSDMAPFYVSVEYIVSHTTGSTLTHDRSTGVRHFLIANNTKSVTDHTRRADNRVCCSEPCVLIPLTLESPTLK